MADYLHIEIEQFEARMPDGRMLLFERRRDLGLMPWLQWIISVYLLPLCFMLTLFGGPFIPLVMISGLLSYFFFIFAIVTLAAITERWLIKWMQGFATAPDRCEVIGMDHAVDKLKGFLPDLSPTIPAEGSIH
ncbi:MAG: hypothetical protein AAFO74_05190 [Pseudomonadota bacterium]